MVALISGKNGFIGGHLTVRLEQLGYKVEGIPRELLKKPDLLKRYFEEIEPDYIFHLAAYGNHSNQKDEQEIFETNVIGTYNMLEESKDINYKAFVNFSTSSVNLSVQTLYSSTKRIGEIFANCYAKTKPIVSIRPYSVYGEGEADFRFIPTVFRSCLTQEQMILAPNAVHDWVYVGDLVNEVIKYADELRNAIGEFGTGIGTTNKRVVEIIEEITGKKANIKGNLQLRLFDNSNWISKSTGQTISLEEGLKKTYEYYKERYTK